MIDQATVRASLQFFERTYCNAERMLLSRALAGVPTPIAFADGGITEDRVAISRRTRRLMLDELLAGALILYPTYVSRTTGRFTMPERALDELLEWRRGQPARLPFWRQSLRWFLGLGKR